MLLDNYEIILFEETHCKLRYLFETVESLELILINKKYYNSFNYLVKLKLNIIIFIKILSIVWSTIFRIK